MAEAIRSHLIIMYLMRGHKSNNVNRCYLVTKSCVTLLQLHGPVACQAPLSMGFPRQEYWSWLPFPSPGYLPDPGIESMSPALQVDSLSLSHQGNLFI